MNNYEIAPNKEKPVSIKQKLAALAIAGASLTGVGAAYVQSQDEAPKATLQTQEQGDVNAERYAELIKSLEAPKAGDTYAIASATFDLRAGATVGDGHGNKAVLQEDLPGVQYPAWSPDGKELCFTISAGNANCFSLSENANFVTAIEMTKDGWAKADLAKFTPDSAVQATVTVVEPDGFAFGKYADAEGYIAGRPTN